MSLSNAYAFERAFEVVLDHEGGLVNDPADPGGITAFGISQRSYPELIIEDLTVEDVREIYWRDYWTMYHYDKLPPRVAIKVMDTAVNVGPRKAHMWLQKGLNALGADVDVDGIFGRQTIHSAHDCDDHGALLELIAEAQAEHYQALAAWSPKMKRFLNGWLKRARRIPT